MRHVLLWMDVLYLTTFGLYILTLGKASNIYFNSDWICLKEESQIHLGCFVGE